MIDLLNRTELAEEILSCEESRRMVNMVSPIYGESYVGLWLFQAIGAELDRLRVFLEELELQLNPATATWMLPEWEKRFGITPEVDWTTQQRRDAIISKRRLTAPITAKKLEDICSALVGARVDIDENTGKNKFTVYVRDNVTVEQFKAAADAIEQAKPAHLIYDLNIAERNDAPVAIYTAFGAAQKVQHFVEVHS